MEKDTLIKINPDNENTIKLKGVTKKQIKLFKDKKMPVLMALGLFGGAGLNYAFMSASGKMVPSEDEISEDSFDEGSNSEAEEVFDFEVPTTIEFSDAVTDDMSFGEAYKIARADTDGSGFYNWRGSTYHTLNKEEWDALSPEEQQEFLDKINEHSDFDNGEYNKIDDTTHDVVDDTTEDEVIDEKEEAIDDKDDDVIDDKEDDIVDDESEDEVIDDKDEDVIDDKADDDVIDDKEKETIEDVVPDEVTIDDIEDLVEDKDYNADADDYVTIDEIGDIEDIIEGLNDGKATDEADGKEGGDTYNPEDYESDTDDLDNSDDDLEYDNDDLDDLV